MAKRKVKKKKASPMVRRTAPAKTIEAKIAVVEVPKELAVVIALPAPLAKAPVLTWQARGKRLAIRIKKFVLAK